MSDDRAFERTTSEWLEAGSDRTPPHAIEAVLLAIRTTPTGTGSPDPVEDHPHADALRVAAVVAIVAVAGVVTINLLRPGPDAGVGGPPIASRSASTAASPDGGPDRHVGMGTVRVRAVWLARSPTRSENWEVEPATRDSDVPSATPSNGVNPGSELF